MVKEQKKRLDCILVDKGFVETREASESLIRAGAVYVNEEIADKPGTLFPGTAAIRVKNKIPFVSRGGIKLQGALKYFDIQPLGWICADVGASSGGFTDCLLQHGARHVYAIDVAYGQLDWKLRTDHRVTVHERLNIKNIRATHITSQLDLAVFDVSFISLTTVIPPILPFFGSITRILALIKPQFELPRHEVESGGVVKDEHLRLKAIERVEAFAAMQDFKTSGVIPSAIKGPKGNQEYLIYLTRS